MKQQRIKQQILSQFDMYKMTNALKTPDFRGYDISRVSRAILGGYIHQNSIITCIVNWHIHAYCYLDIDELSDP